MGLEVVSGLFEFTDRHGVPLPMVLTWLKESNLVPCWVSYIVCCEKYGWKQNIVLSKMRSAVMDAYGKEHWSGMEEKTMIVLMMVYKK